MKHLILVVFVFITLFLIPKYVHAQDYTQEEYAVYNRCEFIAPGSVCPEPQKPEPSFLESIGAFLSRFFFDDPENPKKIEDQSKAKQKSLIPKELTVITPDYEDTVEDTIRNKNGIYGYTMPGSITSDFTTGRQTECAFNNANFPTGVSVFTDDSNCPTITTGQ